MTVDSGAIYRLLGRMVVPDDTLCSVRRRERVLLGVLLLEAGSAVPVERLLDLLWDGVPPRSARAGLHTHVARLRARLRQPGGLRLSARDGGYLAAVDPQAVDVHRFRALAATAAAQSDPVARVTLLRRAVALWRGPILAGDASARLRERIGVELDILRLDCVALLMDAELARGRHREIVGELTVLTVEHPHREDFVCRLMLALYRCGRQAEALEHFHRLRRRLAEDLGLQPGPTAARLYASILRHDIALD
jgi:DNA-binding SARP family transcriptional activator